MIAFHVTDAIVYSFDVGPGKLDVVEFNEDEELVTVDDEADDFEDDFDDDEN